MSAANYKNPCSTLPFLLEYIKRYKKSMKSKYSESNFVTKKEANGLSIGRYKKKYRASNLSQKKRQMVSVNEDIRKANSKSNLSQKKR